MARVLMKKRRANKRPIDKNMAFRVIALIRGDRIAKPARQYIADNARIVSLTIAFISYQ